MKTAIRMLFLLLAGTFAASAAESDTGAENVAVVRQYHDALNRSDWKSATQYFAVDSRNFGNPAGRPVISRILEDIYRTFPDFRLIIVDAVSQGDVVVVRAKEKGTHRGVGRVPVNGGMLVGVAPTNKQFEVDTIHWYKLRDGKIIDHYATRNDLSMMQQLGLSPKPEPFDWAKFAADANKPQP
jgi:predicted ester cyclase